MPLQKVRQAVGMCGPPLLRRHQQLQRQCLARHEHHVTEGQQGQGQPGALLQPRPSTPHIIEVPQVGVASHCVCIDAVLPVWPWAACRGKQAEAGEGCVVIVCRWSQAGEHLLMQVE